MKTPQYKKLLRLLKNATECNLHTDSRIAIAIYFKLDDCFDALLEIKQRHERLGSISYSDTLQRNEITTKMKRDVLASCMSEEIRDEVFSCI